MRRNDALEAAQAELAEAGVKFAIDTNGKHIKLTWQVGNATRSCVVSKTSSDIRAAINTRLHVRRMLKADGLVPQMSTVPTAKLAKAIEAPGIAGPSLSEQVGALEQAVARLTDALRVLEEQLLERAENGCVCKEKGSGPDRMGL